MAMTLEQFMQRRRQQRQQAEARLCGCGCGKTLDLSDKPESLAIDGRLVRSDCYYAAMGDIVERFPIHHPRAGRGQSNLG